MDSALIRANNDAKKFYKFASNAEVYNEEEIVKMTELVDWYKELVEHSGELAKCRRTLEALMQWVLRDGFDVRLPGPENYVGKVKLPSMDAISVLFKVVMDDSEVHLIDQTEECKNGTSVFITMDLDYTVKDLTSYGALVSHTNVFRRWNKNDEDEHERIFTKGVRFKLLSFSRDSNGLNDVTLEVANTVVEPILLVDMNEVGDLHLKLDYEHEIPEADVNDYIAKYNVDALLRVALVASLTEVLNELSNRLLRCGFLVSTNDKVISILVRRADKMMFKVSIDIGALESFFSDLQGVIVDERVKAVNNMQPLLTNDVVGSIDGRNAEMKAASENFLEEFGNDVAFILSLSAIINAENTAPEYFQRVTGGRKLLDICADQLKGKSELKDIPGKEAIQAMTKDYYSLMPMNVVVTYICMMQSANSTTNKYNFVKTPSALEMIGESQLFVIEPLTEAPDYLAILRWWKVLTKIRSILE
ncbi:hypothetical protein FQR65_LT21008 [Abscondita terminalis]|nr:hypothetical protein FQR65_LT21008 [Abscondita terminalis]